MKKNLLFTISIILCISMVQAQQTIPDFTVKESHTGEEYNLYDLLRSGKAVVIDFWASWCGPCIQSSAELNNFYKSNGKGEENLEVLGITIEDDDTEEIVNNLAWGGEYPKFAYTQTNNDQYLYYAANLNYNPEQAIPFFIYICPNQNDPGASTIMKGDVGYQSGMFVFQYQFALNDCVEGLSTSVEQIENLVAYAVYPNPASEQLNVQFYLSESLSSDISIYNALGQEIKSLGRLQYGVGEHLLEIDLNGFDNGMYVLVYATDAGKVSRKFSVNR